MTSLPAKKPPANNTAIIFGLALFLSAAMLFAIQPMTGKMLLPLVGGAPAGWVVSMAFFQFALLGGYCLIFALGRLPPLYHGLGYLAFLGVGALWLLAGLATKYLDTLQISPAFTVVKMLFGGVGMPFVAIATSGPTLQRLYSASNLGSFAGLLSYPFVLEPLLPIGGQKTGWALCYALLALLATACTVLILRAQPSMVSAHENETHPAAKPGWRVRGLWLLYAAIPSSLIMGLTTKITTDVMSIPLIWIIPLSLYLLTLVLAFSRRRFMSLAASDFMALIMITALIVGSVYNISGHQVSIFAVGLIGFFFTSLSLHMHLARCRPDIRYLTEFYLFMSLGGALGGAFNAFLAPVIFLSYWEYYIAIMIALFIIVKNQPIPIKNKKSTILFFIALISFTGSLYTEIQREQIGQTHQIIGVFLSSIAIICAIILALFPRKMTILLMAMIVGDQTRMTATQLDQGRSFYGISRVSDNKFENGKTIRIYAHGTTMHGAQIVAPQISTQPLTYYAPSGPTGDIFNLLAPKNVALVGLGTGSLSCYNAPGRHLTYFEIDPEVVSMSKKWFSFIRDCGIPNIIIGDGRLALAAQNQKFDMILLDAFSSDSIPIHLLTSEALQIYLDRLPPDGVVVFHISNRFFNLARPISALASAHGLSGKIKIWPPSHAEKENFTAVPASYIVLSRTAEKIVPFAEHGWRPLNARPNAKVWRDDYANILSALGPLSTTAMKKTN